MVIAAMVPMSSARSSSGVRRRPMSTAIGVTSTVRLSPGWNIFYFWGVWAICIIGIGIVLWVALKSKRWAPAACAARRDQGLRVAVDVAGLPWARRPAGT